MTGIGQIFGCANIFPIFFLSEPKFVGSVVIPDNDDPADDKVYFFFTEKVSTTEAANKAVYSRVARVCAVSVDNVKGKDQGWQNPL